MPVIRQLEAQRGLETGSAPSTQIDTSIARGAQALAAGIGDMGQAAQAAQLRLDQQKMEMQQFRADQEFRRLNTRLAGEYAERQVNIDPSGEGFASTVAEDFSARYDEFLQTVPAALRPGFQELAANEQESWITKAAATEADQRNTWYREGVADAVSTQQNQVFDNPALYQAAIDEIYRAIDLSGLPPTEKEDLRESAAAALGQTVAERYLRDEPDVLTPDALGLSSREGYFNAIRAAESSGDDQADNPRSSAYGRYQFTSGTWQGLVERYPDAGLTANGRGDPRQQEIAIRLFTSENERALAGAGIHGTNANLYAAHFLGAGDAKRVLKAPDATRMADIVSPEVISANGFLRGMTVADFKRWTAQKTNDDGAPQPVEEFAGLDFSQRLEIYDRAIARQQDMIDAREAQRKTQYDALKGSLELGIVTGEVASEQTILGAGLSDSDTATLVRSFRAAQGSDQAASEFLRNWSAGTQPNLNPYSSDDRALAGDAYESLMSVVGEDERAAVTAQFVRDTGVVPNQVVAGARQQLTSLDITQVQAGLEQAARLYDAAPQGLQAVEHGSQVKDAALFYDDLVNGRGLTATQAAQRYLDANDPAKRQSRDVLSGLWSEVEEEFSLGDLTSAFDRSGLPFLGDVSAGATPEQQGALLADYIDYAEDAFYRSNGDVELARSMALDEMKRTYGVSEVSGNPMIMRLPPENFYPPIDGGHGYIRQFALRDARSIDPAASEVMLQSVPGQTNMDVQAGVAPSYALFYRTGDGTPWQMAPQPFSVAPDEMQSLSRIVSQERELAFQLQREAAQNVPSFSPSPTGIGVEMDQRQSTPQIDIGAGGQAPTQNTQSILDDLNAQREQLLGTGNQSPINIPIGRGITPGTAAGDIIGQMGGALGGGQ